MIRYPIRGGFMTLNEGSVSKVRYLDWFITDDGYAAAYVRGKRFPIMAHQLLKGFPKNREVDHLNGDRLDNRLENLEVVSKIVNLKRRRWEK